MENSNHPVSRLVQDLSKEELISELKTIAKSCKDNTSFREKVAKQLPGIAATALFANRGYMVSGMAMSFWHEGNIYF